MSIEDKKKESVREAPIPVEQQELLRTKKKRKNLVKREEEERVLQEMLADLDADTYAIMKKLK